MDIVEKSIGTPVRVPEFLFYPIYKAEPVPDWQTYDKWVSDHVI
jgi:hypothetical protein